MATTTQPAAAESTKKLINYRKDGGVAIIEMFDPPANTYTYEMNRHQLGISYASAPCAPTCTPSTKNSTSSPAPRPS